MKTKTGSSRLALLAIAMTAACVSQPVFGVPDHQLVLTENSSTSLTVTYDGNPVAINLSFDNYWVMFITGVIFYTAEHWIEPENANSVNLFVQRSAAITVVSDIANGINFGAQPNGFTFVAAGTDTRDNVPIDVTFHDNATASEAVHPAPDTGTTFSLFGLSLTGLALLRRKFC